MLMHNLCALAKLSTFLHNILIEDTYKLIVMAKIKWLQDHPEKSRLPEPVKILCNDV